MIMTEQEVYQFYNDTVKVIYSEIEAKNNTLPVELLFEINSAFDHLKRIHVDGESEDYQAQKAYSHLKRGCLDAFKLKLKYFNVDVTRVYNKKADLRIIDNGQFLSDFIKAKSEIFKIAKDARLNEGKNDTELALQNWSHVSVLIDSFEEKFFDSTKLHWAEKQSFFHFNVNFWLGVLAGIISSVAVTLLFDIIL